MIKFVTEVRYLEHHLRVVNARNTSLSLDDKIDWIADTASTLETIILKDGTTNANSDAMASRYQFYRVAKSITDLSPDQFEESTSGPLLDQALDHLYQTTVLMGKPHYPRPPRIF